MSKPEEVEAKGERQTPSMLPWPAQRHSGGAQAKDIQLARMRCRAETHLSTNLVTALAGLNVNDLPHVSR